ncbi:MAG: hypothetical protein V1798_01275, partial [Pseudomonadota bacterium]
MRRWKFGISKPTIFLVLVGLCVLAPNAARATDADAMRQCLDRMIPHLRTMAPDPKAEDVVTYFQTLADSTTADTVRKQLQVIDPSRYYSRTHIEETSDGLNVLLGPKRDPNTPRITVHNEPLLPPPSPLRGSGLRNQSVVLDAGQMGTVLGQPWAVEEGKFHRYHAGQVNEAWLALGTTIRVGQMLTEAGARPIFTRTENPIDEFPRGTGPLFLKFLRENNTADPAVVRFFEDAESGRKLSAHGAIYTRAFEYYRRFDLARRACVAITENPNPTPAGILEKTPQVTDVSIHWNAAHLKPRQPFSPENGISAGIPGGFRRDAMSRKDKAFSATQLVLGGATDDSLALAHSLSRAVQESTNLPSTTHGSSSGPGWTADGWYRYDVEDAIYLRWDDVMILREVPGPVVVIEGPFFTNPEE